MIKIFGYILFIHLVCLVFGILGNPLLVVAVIVFANFYLLMKWLSFIHSLNENHRYKYCYLGRFAIVVVELNTWLKMNLMKKKWIIFPFQIGISNKNKTKKFAFQIYRVIWIHFKEIFHTGNGFYLLQIY